MSTGESYQEGRKKGFKNGYEQGKFDAIAELGYLSVEDLKRDLKLGKLWEELANVGNGQMLNEEDFEKYQDIFYQIKELVEGKEKE